MVQVIIKQVWLMQAIKSMFSKHCVWTPATLVGYSSSPNRIRANLNHAVTATTTDSQDSGGTSKCACYFHPCSANMLIFVTVIVTVNMAGWAHRSKKMIL